MDQKYDGKHGQHKMVAGKIMPTPQLATRPAMQETTVAAGPLFVVGCGCSGTTLLRLMLTAHPDLAIPYESHFMYEVMRGHARGIWPTDLTDTVTWLRLLAFIVRHPRLQRWDFDRDALYKRLQQLEERSYRDAFQAVFDEFRGQQGKTRWGDKTPQHVQYMMVLS